LKIVRKKKRSEIENNTIKNNKYKNQKHFRNRVEISPGKITKITGPNASGKTSVIESIRGAVKGGHCVELMRNGASESEIAIIFNDGSNLKKTINRKTSDVKLTDKDGHKIKKAASFLKDMIDPFGLNPVLLLTATPKELTSIILDSIPLPMPRDELKAITGIAIKEEESRHPLQVIQEQYEMLMEDRKSLKLEAKAKTGVVDEMQGTMPFKKDSKNWEQALSSSRSELAVAESDQVKEINSTKDILSINISAYEKQAQKMIDEIKVQMGKAIVTGKDLISIDIMLNGLMDVLEGKDSLLDDTEVSAMFRKWQTAAREKQAASAGAEGKTYLEENGKKEGVITLPSGLQYEVLRPGTSTTPTSVTPKLRLWGNHLISVAALTPSPKAGPSM